MIDELAAIREIGAVEDPAPEVFARARQALGARTSMPNTSPRRRQRWGLAGAGAALTVAMAALLVTLLSASSSQLGISPAAAATLRRAAHAAGLAPAIPAGRYLYTRSTIRELELTQPLGSRKLGGYRIRTTQETWVNRAGAGRLRSTETSIARLPGQTGPLPPLQRPLTVPIDATRGEGLPDVVNPSGWPTTPAALRTAIVRRLEGGREDTSTTFFAIIYLLRETPDPALRSACFRALATLPGITGGGPAVDMLGRHGQGLAMTSSGLRTEIIIDPASGLLLQVQTTVVTPHASDVPAYRALPAGTALTTQTITKRAVVTGDRPAP